MGLVPKKEGGGVGDRFITDMFHWNKSVDLRDSSFGTATHD
jgi:hypothetical protein